VLFAAKEREARRWLPALMSAAAALPAIQLAIKPHPAETPDVYATVTAGLANVRVLGSEAPLPALLAAARAIVTVNSTVAIDALTLGVPSVVIGLPNNLTPFVEAGLMVGGNSAGEIREAIEKVLYNQEFRRRIEGRRAAGAPGRAAARSAEAIAGLVGAM
jgi:UDP:flavonoid glycosyltransferase YjiC (YdhE family)